MAVFKFVLLLLAPLGALACGQHFFERGRLLEETSAPAAVGAVAAPGPASAPQPHWNYNDNGLSWTGACTGKAQSPIAINTEAVSAELPESALAQLQLGTAKGLRIFNTGHALQVEWDSLEGSNTTVPVVGNAWTSIFDSNTLSGADVRQVPVKPLQIHWHSTCEHVVDGSMCPLELHIVTAVDAKAGVEVPEKCKTELCLAVFGVLIEFNRDVYQPGEALYDVVTNNMPDAVGAKSANTLPDATIDLDSLLPEDKEYVTYSGSLTAPPCSEGVQWHVFTEPKRELSAEQLDNFQAIMATTQAHTAAACPASEIMGDAAGPGGATEVELECEAPSGARTNNRAVQPINGRTLLISDGAVSSSSTSG